jgi:hypothetical protein
VSIVGAPSDEERRLLDGPDPWELFGRWRILGNPPARARHSAW